MNEKKSAIRFLSDDERNEEIEKSLAKGLTIGEPEHLIKGGEEEKEIKDPEERQYLLLYIASDDKGEDIKSFEFITGRTATYKFIKGIIESLDIHESKVLVETVTLKEIVSVYDFMKHISSLLEDNFDIEDYNYGDGIEE